MFLEIPQNSKENACARAYFLIKLQSSRLPILLKKRLWHRCFPVNFVKFLRTPFFTEHLWATASGYQRSSLEHCSLWWLSLFNSSPNAFASRIRCLFSSDKPYFTKLICLKWRKKWFNLILTKMPALKPTLE